MPAVEVENLVIRYGDLTAVDGVSFTAEAGEVTCVLGPNGAGKTSTIEHLEGYRRAASGRARVLGLDPVADHTALTRRVGVMLQDGGVPNGIRPPEVLAQYASFFPDPRDPEELLELVGLTHRRRSTWRRLSGGEQQRLSLALCLIGRPEVAFLDEPTSGIDLEGRALIRRLVGELRAEGVCVVLTTHDLDEAERIADRVIIVHHGRVVADGSPAELMRSGEGRTLRFGAPGGLDTAALAARVGAPVNEDTPGEYVVAADATPALVAAVTSWLADHDLPLADLRAGRRRLDDVFLELTRSRGVGDASGSGDLADTEEAGRRHGRTRRERRGRR